MKLKIRKDKPFLEKIKNTQVIIGTLVITGIIVAVGMIDVSLHELLIQRQIIINHAAEINNPNTGTTTMTKSRGMTNLNSQKNDTSQSLASIKPIPPITRSDKFTDNLEKDEEEKEREFKHTDQPDSVVQKTFSLQGGKTAVMPSPLQNFEGISASTEQTVMGVPDTTGEAGPNNYVQVVNMSFQVFDKQGNSLYGPTDISTIYSGFGTKCEDTLGAYTYDPVLLYDQLADRWIISSPYREYNDIGMCIAVSSSGDPLGSWHRYAYQFSTDSNDWIDYPKMAVWPDGYYMNAHTRGNNQPFVFQRSAMLNGLPASYQTPGIQYYQLIDLPVDLEGTILPQDGNPAYFLGMPLGNNTLPIYKFHVDWNTPANSYFGEYYHPSVAGWTTLNTDIPQLGTQQRLDRMTYWLMFRATYRKFADGHEGIVANHIVNIDNHAAIRWYEIRDLDSPVVYQQGTYAPDSTSRWMGSIAMDKDGNIALGYSTSSEALHPGIRYTGRLTTDPLGELSQEETLFEGTGSQIDTNRWGDYSDLTIDPDGCTFWYTTEYQPSTVIYVNWHTRIGSFKFPSCVPNATPTPTVTPANTPEVSILPSPTPYLPTHTPTPGVTVFPSPTPSTCTVSGKVIDVTGIPQVQLSCLTSGRAMPSIRVVLSKSDITTSTVTGRDGRFTISNVSDGIYDVCVNPVPKGFVNVCNLPRDDGSSPFNTKCAKIDTSKGCDNITLDLQSMPPALH